MSSDPLPANDPPPAPAVKVSRARTCGARCKRTGKPCISVKVMPNGRCRMHGGKSTGPKTWKAGGRFSKGLGKLASRMHEALQAADILDLTQPLALMDLATNMRLERGLTEGDTPVWRKECQRLLKAFQTAVDAEHGKVAGAAHGILRELQEHVEKGVTSDEAVADAVELANLRSVRTEKALGIQLAQEHAITERQLLAYMAVFMGTIEQHVPHEVFVRAAIAADRSVLQAGAGAIVRTRIGRTEGADAVPAEPGRVLPRGAGLVPMG